MEAKDGFQRRLFDTNQETIILIGTPIDIRSRFPRKKATPQGKDGRIPSTMANKLWFYRHDPHTIRDGIGGSITAGRARRIGPIDRSSEVERINCFSIASSLPVKRRKSVHTSAHLRGRPSSSTAGRERCWTKTIHLTSANQWRCYSRVE
ncbi:hypothetical protein K402DRAFT_164264 [Aulographum hederae CBS 113979]|uniref:Uncharacterized protein n=1 Tax=Aulographum hederae CBS 113979 TaxID=1176131 RepID=A0A6G1GRZ0_9PEZI|nr:hypothetical protein K402DRAFT_164264 [Aulographum hederae CBS 113979]